MDAQGNLYIVQVEQKMRIEKSGAYMGTKSSILSSHLSTGVDSFRLVNGFQVAWKQRGVPVISNEDNIITYKSSDTLIFNQCSKANRVTDFNHTIQP